MKAGEEMQLNARGLWFAILKDGVGTCNCGALSHRFGPGDVFVVDSASRGKIQVRDSGEMIFWSFVVELEHLFPLFSGREVCMLQAVADSFKTGRFYSGSGSVAKECLRLAGEIPAQFSLNHRSHVLRIASAILASEFKAMQPKLDDFVPMRDHVLQVFDQLQTDDLLTRSVGELAKKFNCSRRHLNRLFHQHFGLSVAAMRMEMRLLKAVSLLVDPDAKIIYVAEKCGFNHLGLFNTCFKKRFGTSPSQWRKVLNQAKTNPSEIDAAHCPLQTYGGCAQADKTIVSGGISSPSRPLERVPLCGLFRDLLAAKNVIGHKEANGSGYSISSPRDARARISA